MNILIAINSKYIRPAKNMLRSLADNCSENLDVYLLYSSLSNDEINEFENFVKSKCFGELHPIRVDESQFINNPLGHQFTVEIYFRLLAPYLLPNAIDRILWIDADMIVCNSIDDFYHQNFRNNLIIACADIWENHNYVLQIKEKLGLNHNHRYFNSGLMMFNLKKIREEIHRYNSFELIQKYKNVLTMPDQDILNIMYQEKVGYDDNQIYNVQVRYNEKVNYNEIISKAHIIHFIGKVKPWNYRFASEIGKEFWKYDFKNGYYVQWLLFKIINPLIKISEYIYRNIKKQKLE